MSSQDIASGTHLDHDASLMTLNDSLVYARTEGILNPGDGHQGHLTREFFVGNLIGGLEVGASWGPQLKVLVAERDCPQHLVGVEDDCPWDIVLADLVDGLGPNLRVRVLALVRVFGYDNVAGALHEDFQGSLEE